MVSSTDKRPLQSKKWFAMVIGVVCAMVVFLTSVITMALKDNIAAHIGSLANVVIVFLGTMVSVLITGQSAVDWKHTSSSSAVSSDEQKTFVEKTEAEIKQKNDLIETYRNKHIDDESYKPIDPETEKWK